MKQLPGINRLVELQSLMLKLRQVKRAMPIHSNLDDTENVIEHSYSMAILALYLAPKIDPSLDMGKITAFCLIHDILEVYAGDSPAFNSAWTKEDQAKRELDARKRLKEEWPDFPQLHGYIGEYEDLKSKEACFVSALDVTQANLMIEFSKDMYWKHYGVTPKRFATFVQTRSKKFKSQAVLYDYSMKMFSYFSDHPELLHQENDAAQQD